MENCSATPPLDAERWRLSDAPSPPHTRKPDVGVHVRAPQSAQCRIRRYAKWSKKNVFRLIIHSSTVLLAPRDALHLSLPSPHPSLFAPLHHSFTPLLCPFLLRVSTAPHLVFQDARTTCRHEPLLIPSAPDKGLVLGQAVADNGGN